MPGIRRDFGPFARFADAAMSVCHAASIGIDQDEIEYTGPNGAHWRVPISRVRVLGEYRSAEDGPGTLLAFLIDDSGTFLQAPSNAIGVNQLLQKLAEHWGTALSAEHESTPSGRVLWPRNLFGEPLFESNRTPKELSLAVLDRIAR